ncbi:MAG: hypothetical protein IPI12_15540 [Ignavibacteriales bacterium]|jgi:hypothetical protein|nr:hypothetical protein [Ignavibacteriales bacterium]
MKTIILLIVITSLLFEGCMMGMMGGMEHGSEGNKNSQMNSATKEVIVSHYSLVAEFPAAVLNGQADYTLNITDRETKQNIKSAEVWFVTGDENKQVEFSQTKLNQNLTGEYSASYTLDTEDSKLIGFKIHSINSEHFQIPIEIFIEQQAVMDHSEHSGIMGYAPYMIGGVVMMGGMMLLLMSR